MTEREVFYIIKKILIDHFPHRAYVLSMACYVASCRSKDCWNCWFHRSNISKWEISCVLPEIECAFGHKCPLESPDLQEIVGFYAGSV